MYQGGSGAANDRNGAGTTGSINEEFQNIDITGDFTPDYDPMDGVRDNDGGYNPSSNNEFGTSGGDILECSFCTFHNQPGSRVCTMCESPF